MSKRVFFSGMLMLTAACAIQALNAQGTLVCKGPFEGSQTILLAFAPGVTPAPTLGAACAKKGTTAPVGQVVQGTPTVPFGLVTAVVIGPASTAGGANTSGAGPAGATLVCQGTRLNGTPFTFPFVPNTSPAPTLGVACVPSGKQMPKGTAVMGTAPKAAKVFAVVFVPPTTAGGASTTAGGGTTAAGGTPSTNQQCVAAGFGTNPPGPPMIADGIAMLQDAKQNLQGAGDKWGPHRVDAIKSIDQALVACGVCTQEPANAVAPSGPWANLTSMKTATTQVTTAQRKFQNAKNPWGGRRDKALPFISQALEEIKLAMASYSGPTVQ